MSISSSPLNLFVVLFNVVGVFFLDCFYFFGMFSYAVFILRVSSICLSEQFTYSLWSVSLFFFSSFLFFVVGLFWFSSFSQSVAFFFVLFLYLFIFLLSFRVSFVFEVLHSVSDSLLVSLLSSRFKIFIGRFFDRLGQLRFEIMPCGHELALGTKYEYVV